MTTADLSRRAGVALRELHALGAIESPWLAGMAATGPGWFDVARICAVDDDGEPTLWEYRCYCRGPWVAHTPGDETPWDESHTDPSPDLTDPVTLAAMLPLAREAWGDAGLWCEPDGGDLTRWATYRSNATSLSRRVSHGATEAEALVAALEARVVALRSGT